MVYFFTATYTPPLSEQQDDDTVFLETTTTTTTSSRTQSYEVYMGKDKFENDLLIQYGLDTDVWFHVDNLSSAHVYLRMKPGMTLDDIPESIVLDCAALCKANSIAGCKQATSCIVYTRWKNLKKTPDMVQPGQIGYHRPENVRKLKVEKHNDRVKKLNKTRVEKQLSEEDLYTLQQEYLKDVARQKKKVYEQLAKKKQQEKRKQQEEKEARSYDRLFLDESKMTSVRDQPATADSTAAEAFEDDFF